MSGKKRKMIITGLNRGIIAVMLEHDRPVTIDIIGETNLLTGNIYLAKVQNIITNISAAFVEIDQGRKCFLPLDHLKPEQVLRCGDEILIQITKDSIGEKAPECTCRLSISGRYCVASYPDIRKGVSSKLGKEEKSKLKNLLETLPIQKTGLIIRTNAAECLQNPVLLEALKQEAQSLSETMEQMITKAAYMPAGTRLYSPSPAYCKRLMQVDFDDLQEIITDISSVHEELLRFAQQIPALNNKIRFYQDPMLSLGKLYRIDSLIQDATSRKVWLKSGGYLIFDQTEALTVIDVNSGKSSKQKSVHKSKVYEQVNHEAALEIAQQIRLRNISGIILIDFINMETKEQDLKLLDILSDSIKSDPVQTDVIDMTVLGLVEMTRKKTENDLVTQLKMNVPNTTT